MVVSSGMGTVVENAPTGAMARVITRATVPLLPTSKVTVTDLPTGTVPASTTGLLTARCATPVTALPDTGNTADPWSLAIRIRDG